MAKKGKVAKEPQAQIGLANRELWRAYPQLLELSKVKLPIKTSLDIAKLANTLEKPYLVIDKERLKIREKYVVRDKEGKKSFDINSPTYPEFEKEFNELLDLEWDKDLRVTKIRLPEKIAGTCPACHHNMDVEFLIEGAVLTPLTDKFIEKVV